MSVGYCTVVVKYSHKVVERLRLERGARTQTRLGILSHDEVAAKEYGVPVKIHSGEVVILPMTPERWIESIEHRTQVLYRTDVAMIIYMAEIRAGHTVVESGAGTLGLTYALSRTVGEKGRVFTFEVNRKRCEEGAKEIAENMDNVVIAERDVVKDGFGLEARADAVILDLPTPHEVVREADRVLAAGGVFVAFVPCIEQVQSLLKKIAEAGSFESPRLFETVEIPHRMRSLRRNSERVYGTAPEKITRGHTGYIVLAHKGPGMYY